MVGAPTARRAAGRSAWSSRQQVDQAEQRDLRGVGLAVEHRLPGEQPADRDAVQPAGEPAVAPRLDRVRPSPARGARCSPPGRRRRSSRRAAAGRRRRRAPRRTRCRPGSRSGGRSGAATGSPASRRAAAPPRSTGLHQPTSPVGARHREQPGAVRRQQRARREVGAERTRSWCGQSPRSRQLPRRRGRLDGHADRT